MPTLLIDTASDTLVVGLSDGGELLAGIERPATRAQSLLVAVDELLIGAGCTRSQLETVAVGVGPGGFTGLRVGVTTARGIASALNIGLAALNSLAAVALPLAREREGEAVWAVLDARRGEYFAQQWRRQSGIAGFSMVAEGDVQLVAHDELGALAPAADVADGPPTASALAELAELAAYGDPAQVLPAYGRAPDAQPSAGRVQAAP